jgi:hypothetical protein
MDSLDHPIKLDLYPSVHFPKIEGSILSHSQMQCHDVKSAEVTQPYCARANLNLENYVVLEKYQAFYLLQDPQTALFYVGSVLEESPILESSSWTAVYRTWLNLRKNQKQHDDRQSSVNPIYAKEISAPQLTEDLHDWVNRHQDNPYFGKLIYRRDRRAEDLLQYAVQLSETMAIRWAPSDSEGRLTLETVSRRQHRLAKWIEPQLQTAIAAALHCSIEIFHQCWDYSPHRFNSEHWARLVGTGHCSSFQKNELLTYWRQTALSRASETTPPEILECNLEAQSLLTEAIASHPAFAKDTPEFFTP